MNGAAKSSHLLIEFFYPIFDNDDGLDICGDLAITEMLKPLICDLRARRLVSFYEFMRYSVEGYHLRVKLYGERGLLSEAESTVVRPALESFRQKYSATLSNPMVLGDFSIRLHERLEAATKQIHRGGDYRIRYMCDVADIYEDEEARIRYLEFGEAICDLILDAVDDLRDLRTRKTLARVMLMDLIDSTNLKPAELHYVLTFIKRQWERYFLIDQDAIDRSYAHSSALAPRFHDFLAARQGLAGSAIALPRFWRDIYISRVAPLSKMVPHLIRFGPQNVINNHTALRLLSMIHLVHNRLGMDILQEILFTELAGSYFEKLLPEEDLANTREWVERNLSQYFEADQKVVY